MSNDDTSDMIETSVALLGDNAAVVRVRGEIDNFTASVVERAIDEAITLGVARLLIDLDGVTFFGSAGLGLLVRRADAAVTAASLRANAVSHSNSRTAIRYSSFRHTGDDHVGAGRRANAQVRGTTGF